LSIPLDSLDLNVPRRSSNEDPEAQVARSFTYLTKVVRHVRRMVDIYGRLKRQTSSWALDPEFRQLGPDLDQWLEELPGDLHVNFPSDGSAPSLASHFVGNLHSYHHLSILMLHRPQLAVFPPSEPAWKQHMLKSYNSAKYLCRLQEAILQQFGLRGLTCMQRGISFTIYSILTCTVLHLVSTMI